MSRVRMFLQASTGAALLLAAPPALAFTAEEIAAAASVARDTELDVRILASDLFEGRLNGDPGGALAREFIVDAVETLGAGLGTGSGRDAYLQTVDSVRVNVVAVLPGGDRADEYVVVGAHYDHLGRYDSCHATGEDTICNGATDNAAGVAAVLAIGRAIRALPTPPSRSVVLALWDGEEHGLLGSKFFTNEDPLVPLGDIATYVNFDIQGSNLAPSLRDASIAIGAESGGEMLTEMTRDAIAATDLGTQLLSVTFGQGRSDYQPFWAKNVPVVFFSDATNACYHTVDDEIDLVDFAKLSRQGEIGFRLVLSLADAQERPTFVPLLAFDTYEDLLALSGLLTRTLADLPLLIDDGWRDELIGLEALARQRVEAGPDAFGPTDALLIAQDTLVIATDGFPCDAQLLPEPSAIGSAVALAVLIVRARRRVA